jgi:type IV secretion system protein VirB3
MQTWEPDMLFLACTRPAMFVGIPIQAFGVLIIGCGEVFVLSGLATHSVWRLVWCATLSLASYGICRMLTAIDHNIFGILFLWLTTKGRASRNAVFWGGSSASPSPLRRPRTAREITFHA